MWLKTSILRMGPCGGEAFRSGYCTWAPRPPGLRQRYARRAPGRDRAGAIDAAFDHAALHLAGVVRATGVERDLRAAQLPFQDGRRRVAYVQRSAKLLEILHQRELAVVHPPASV